MTQMLFFHSLLMYAYVYWSASITQFEYTVLPLGKEYQHKCRTKQSKGTDMIQANSWRCVQILLLHSIHHVDGEQELY